MQILKLDFENIPQLSKIDKAYTKANKALDAFYKHPVQIEAFEQVMLAKQDFEVEKRQILVQELEKQYQDLQGSPSSLANIQLLKNKNCFTVITAHQPNLFTGPLYLIYKVISVLNLCQQLQQQYPKASFVPIFWTGGEDHDFEEVNHLHLFGKKITWDDPQGGPVGAFQIESLQTALQEVVSILGKGEYAKKLSQKLLEYYSNAANYGLAHRQFLNWIFGDEGLVICNANNKAFKQQMTAIFEEELIQQSSKKILEQAAKELQEAGFKNQAHPRDINLFYLTTNRRSRIVEENGIYKVLETDLEFSKQEILKELNNNPQNFSPNVILRPLFQETIFPNLAYIGGGGELAYWLERKKQFEHFNLPFPMLIRRCSVLWIDKGQAKKMKKLGLKPNGFFENIDALNKKYVLQNTKEELSLFSEKEKLANLFLEILQKSTIIDPALQKTVLGLETQTIKGIDKLEKKLIRAEKNKNETALKQIKTLKDKLYPNNGLQERKDNFLAFYSRYGDSFLNTLLTNLNPLEKRFLVFVEE